MCFVGNVCFLCVSYMYFLYVFFWLVSIFQVYQTLLVVTMKLMTKVQIQQNNVFQNLCTVDPQFTVYLGGKEICTVYRIAWYIESRFTLFYL